MKKNSLFLVFFLIIPSAVFAQLDEKKFLNKAETWIDTSLQCEQQAGTDANENTTDAAADASLGNCEVVGKPVFCHLYSPDFTELILHVRGSVQPLVGDRDISSDKYIVFSMAKGVLKAKVFYEVTQKSVGGANASLVRFPQGPDLIRIDDGASYCGSSTAHLYAGIGGKMKKVLDFEYLEECHQDLNGLETLLIPLEDRSLKLLSFRTTARDGTVDYGLSQNLYEPDPVQGVYQSTKGDEQLDFISGYFNWLENHENTGIDIDDGIMNKISSNPTYLEEVIGFLKLSPDDPRRSNAHTFLTVMAGKDFGTSYIDWEKWKTETKTPSNNVDQK